jgi:hypothetical protein
MEFQPFPSILILCVSLPPHHKHIGPQDRLAPADQPNLNQIFAEIEVLLTQQAE